MINCLCTGKTQTAFIITPDTVSDDDSTGAVIGGVVGGIVAVILIIVIITIIILVWYYMKKRDKSRPSKELACTDVCACVLQIVLPFATKTGCEYICTYIK